MTEEMKAGSQGSVQTAFIERTKVVHGHSEAFVRGPIDAFVRRNSHHFASNQKPHVEVITLPSGNVRGTLTYFVPLGCQHLL